MDKLAKKVIGRAMGLCEVCYAPGSQIHHIVNGNGKRKQHERIESLIYLCWDCHFGNKGVHGRDGRKLDIKLKRRLQEEYYSQGYKENEVRELMGGKIY